MRECTSPFIISGNSSVTKKEKVTTRRRTNTPASVPPPKKSPYPLVSALPALIAAYLRQGELGGWTVRTLSNRRDTLGKLVWCLTQKNITACDPAGIEEFFLYLRNGHTEAGGRWGKKDELQPVGKETVKTFHSRLRAFFTWAVSEERIGVSPMAKMKPPISRPDQIIPFSDTEVSALIGATAHTHNPRRDRALLLLMLDTGLRATEVTSLLIADCDLDNNRVMVRLGKGGKMRAAPFSIESRRALYDYLATREIDPAECLFLSERGVGAGGGLTREGLGALYGRVGAIAGIGGRCNPHKMRHTFAVSFLKSGGSELALKQILGHESLVMTARYVSLASADTAKMHEAFSPVSALVAKGLITGRGRKKGK